MRIILAALAFAGGVIPSTGTMRAPAIHVAQMARDVTDAVRKQRAERRNRPHPRQSTKETKR
jgi:hypothetical protein